jgi:hypothetical protein
MYIIQRLSNPATTVSNKEQLESWKILKKYKKLMSKSDRYKAREIVKSRQNYI